jgi:hypothetical protein
MYDGSAAYFDAAIIQTAVVEFALNIQPICLPEEASTDVDKFEDKGMQLVGNNLRSFIL